MPSCFRDFIAFADDELLLPNVSALRAIHSACGMIPSTTAVPYGVSHDIGDAVDVVTGIDLPLVSEVQHDLAELTAGPLVLVAETCRP